MMREILSNTVLLEKGFKNEKLQTNFRNPRFHIKEIMALWWPMITTYCMTELAMQHPKFAMLITYLQQTEIFSTHFPEIWRIQMFTNH